MRRAREKYGKEKFREITEVGFLLAEYGKPRFSAKRKKAIMDELLDEC
jgi:hypothetical protein